MPTADNLQAYRKKRNFKLTSEPQGGTARGGALSFVIQKHAASRLHYDFRLELDGTLKSWAVPKGPSLDPSEKRMAVHVEDHPLDYADFEGVIPPKQYGAGTVIVWDRGDWVPVGDPHAGYKSGKLKFELRGEKLQGRWTLVRMKGRGDERQEPWLLIKEHDEYERSAAEYNVVEELPDSVLSGTSVEAPPKKTAKKAAQKSAASQPPAGARKAKLPLSLAPQLATLVERAPSEGEWLYEIKFDGYRLLARIEGGDVRLFTRNGHDWTAKMKTLAKAIADLKLDDGWLDGEIVVQGSRGVPDFQLLQNAFDTARTQDILYFAFDIPYYAGYDLREVPLRERRDILRRVLEVKTAERVRYSEALVATPESLLHTACEMRMEGLIGKRADSNYVSRRSPNWIKLKCTQRQEFVIGGYTDPKGTRVGLGSLLLGIHDANGKLQYAGNVGTGFNTKLLGDLTAKLEALRADKAPFEPLPKGVKGHWVKPKLVAEVSFAQWTKEGRIRHSVFHGLRTDKPAKAISQEKPVKPSASTERRAPALPEGIKITHPERVIDASTGITKLELAQYYIKAAALMLPHLKERPVSLVRAPDGIGGELFFQKHGEKLRIPGIKQLDKRFDPDHQPLLEIPTAQALIGAVQMNVIELHTWNATTKAIEQPDRMTFDLDPGEGSPWPKMQEAAELVRVLLEELGLKSFLKTSGGKGLHVVVPIKPQFEWDAVKALSQAIVQHLARTLPDRFVAKSGPKNRIGKIFVDYLRNGRGATTAAAWSARARPGMGVSVPVNWLEIQKLKSGAHWNIRNIDERLALADPWADYASAKRQILMKAIKTLDFVPPKK